MEDTCGWDGEVRAHYDRFLGQPSGSRVFGELPAPAPSPLTVLEYEPGSPDERWLYVTLGMSRRSMPQPISGETDAPRRRSELVIFSRGRSPELADSLTDLAVYPFALDTFLAEGHTIAGSPGEGIVEGSPLTDIFLTYPVFADEEFKLIRHRDGNHSHVLWVVPVYTSERLYARDKGPEALHELFDEHEVDPGDLWRPAVVGSERSE